jgi:glyoxylase-like metal-dependent hydrolase (beta-lactamase superfamily II)
MTPQAGPYTGRVEPDGEWQDRVDGPVRIRKLAVEEMDNNVYVVSCTTTGRALLVDAAARPERLREALHDVDPIAVVQTHGHWDHVRAWQDLADDPGLPVWGHADDGELFPVDVDRELHDDEVLEVGELRVRVLHLPGHTPGSLLFRVEGA